MFTYETFIVEIEQLLSESRNFTSQSLGSTIFEKWKYRLKDIVDRIHEEGYRPTCGIYGREFDNRWGKTRDERRNAFVGDLNRTVVELETLVSSFNKFGVPSNSRVSGKPTGVTSEQAKEGNTFHIHGGQVQIGDHNVQNIVNALHQLKNKIDGAEATPEEKHQVAAILKDLISHPLVTSVLGGLAGGVF